MSSPVLFVDLSIVFMIGSLLFVCVRPAKPKNSTCTITLASTHLPPQSAAVPSTGRLSAGKRDSSNVKTGVSAKPASSTDRDGGGTIGTEEYATMAARLAELRLDKTQSSCTRRVLDADDTNEFAEEMKADTKKSDG